MNDMLDRSRSVATVTKHSPTVWLFKERFQAFDFKVAEFNLLTINDDYKTEFKSLSSV